MFLFYCSDQLELYMQGQEKAILDDNEMEDHDPTPNVIGLSLSLSHHLKGNLYLQCSTGRTVDCQ